MKSVTIVLAISIFHFVLGLWLSIKSFSDVFSSFNTGRDLTLMGKITYIIVEVLFFPIVTMFEATNYEGASVVAQYFPFVLNSLFWGILIVFGCKIIFQKNK